MNFIFSNINRFQKFWSITLFKQNKTKNFKPNNVHNFQHFSNNLPIFPRNSLKNNNNILNIAKNLQNFSRHKIVFPQKFHNFLLKLNF
jgi:hypothetical protein